MGFYQFFCLLLLFILKHMWIASFCCTYNMQDDNGICLNLSLVYCFGDKYRNLLQTGTMLVLHC
uniref:Putative ovule protein n=1 Tax=Solanum chacoense TaxID=4108 RepID=A0A0V0HLV3_SOLCH